MHRQARTNLVAYKRDFLSQTLDHYMRVRETLMSAIPSCCPEHALNVELQLLALEEVMMNVIKKLRKLPVVYKKVSPESHKEVRFKEREPEGFSWLAKGGAA